MKAIETLHNNILFRSRLEARWAIYFETMGFDYLYEYEGFDLNSAGWYLPDFYLPHVQMWGEVKPETFTDTELEKLKALVIFTQKPALMLIGTPEQKPYDAWCFDKWSKPNGIYTCDFVLSNYHNYYQKEKRFYGATGDGLAPDDMFDDIAIGILAAKSARF